MIRFVFWLLALGIASHSVAPASARPGPANVGFQHLRDRTGTEIGIWYPTGATPAPHAIELYTQDVAPDGAVLGHGLPLIVLAHGNGGSYAGHYDSALALAQAGFVVAALTHPGDNWRDQSRATDIVARPRQLSALIDYMLGEWPDHAAIDPRRIGAFGFSAGGLTVLIAAGGRPDLARVAPHCAAHPHFYDCRLIAAHPVPLAVAVAPDWHADPRLRAIAVAAPALGFAFDRRGLAGITVPVQLWRAADDEILPHPFYAEAVARALAPRPDYRVVPGAGHFSFLAPCSVALAQVVPMLCHDATGFDRTAFHASFDAALVAFFERTLRSRGAH